MTDFNQLATEEVLQKTKQALEKNGFRVIISETGAEAKTALLGLLPEGSKVMTNTSTTMDQIGATEAINASGKYVALHEQILKMDREKEGERIKEIRSVPDYATGSFHAVTEDGHIMIASGSGSQLPGYAYGANHVIFVAGTHKIVKDMDMGIRRIYEHSLPLESLRINKVYNTNVGSNPRRILIMNSESDMNKGRATVILVKEVLGF